MEQTIQYAHFLYPQFPLDPKYFTITGTGIPTEPAPAPASPSEEDPTPAPQPRGITGTFADFDKEPLTVSKNKCNFTFELTSVPLVLTHIVYYVIRGKSITGDLWHGPSVSVTLKGPKSGQTKGPLEYTAPQTKIPEMFGLATLPCIGAVKSVEVSIAAEDETRLVSVFLVAGSTPDSIANEHRAMLVGDFLRMASPSTCGLKPDLQIISSLPNQDKEPVNCHRYPMAIMSKLIARSTSCEIHLPLSRPVIELVKRFAYGDFGVIVDRSTDPVQLICGAGEFGPHRVPPRVVAELGTPTVFLQIGRVLDSPMMLQAASHAIVGQNLFAVAPETISWVLANGTPELESLLIARLRESPFEIDNSSIASVLREMLSSGEAHEEVPAPTEE